MASPDSSSQFDFDIEDIEITEVDTALIREMLDELEKEDKEELTDVQPLPVMVDHDLEWPEGINEMILSLPSDEMMAWYPEDVIGSLEFALAEYHHPEVYSSSDDFSYGCLWESS